MKICKTSGDILNVARSNALPCKRKVGLSVLETVDLLWFWRITAYRNKTRAKVSQTTTFYSLAVVNEKTSHKAVVGVGFLIIWLLSVSKKKENDVKWKDYFQFHECVGCILTPFCFNRQTF